MMKDKRGGSLVFGQVRRLLKSQRFYSHHISTLFSTLHCKLFSLHYILTFFFDTFLDFFLEGHDEKNYLFSFFFPGWP